MSKSREVIGQVGIYSGASLVVQLVGVAGAVIMRYFLGPLQTGVWSLVQIILSYVDYSTFGATYAISNEIPLRRGQGRLEEVERAKNVVFSFSLLMSVLLSCAVLAYAVSQKKKLSQELFYGLVITAALVVLQQLNNVLISFLRAYKEFKIAAKQMMISSVLNLLLIGFLSHAFKLYGFMVAMTLSFIFNVLYILYYWRVRFRWSLDGSELKKLIGFGFPLMILTLVSTLLLTIDKIMISSFLGLESLGLYSIAVMTVGFIYSFPNSVGIVTIPNVAEKYGEKMAPRDLRNYLLKSNAVFSTLMPLLIGFAWFAVPYAVSLLLRKFEGGTDAVKTLALSAYFLAATQPYANFVVVLKKHLFQIPLVLSSCGAAFFANRYALASGYGITGVGVATTTAMFVHFTTIYFFSSRYALGTRERLEEYARILFKFLCMLMLLWGLDKVVRIEQKFFCVAVKCALLIVFYLPLLVRMERKLNILDALKQRFIRP